VGVRRTTIVVVPADIRKALHDFYLIGRGK
jgi:hypothetical protein